MLSVTSVTALQTTCHQSSVAASSGALGMPPVSGHRVSKHRRLRLHRPLLQDGASQLTLSRRLRRLAPQALPAQAPRPPAGPAASCGARYPGSVACTLPRPSSNTRARPEPHGPRELPEPGLSTRTRPCAVVEASGGNGVRPKPEGNELLVRSVARLYGAGQGLSLNAAAADPVLQSRPPRQ